MKGQIEQIGVIPAAQHSILKLVVAFGVSALLLAMLGIYGILSYSVAARQQEIGVRMALGATRARIYRLTFGEAGIPVFGGLVAGLVTGLLAGRAIENVLYDARGFDPILMLIVVAVFLAATAVAGFLPARRAASVDPMDALRSD